MADPRLIFFYDLGSAECYLAGEQVMSSLPAVPEWEPVLGAEFGVGAGASDRRAIEARARELGLQEMRWPAVWPADTRTAMLTATYAKQVGRAVAFSLAAFRQAFAGGRDLGDESTVLIAAAACEMHPAAVLKAIELRSVQEALCQAGARARAAGVTALPSIQADDGRLWSGERALEEAALALG